MTFALGIDLSISESTDVFRQVVNAYSSESLPSFAPISVSCHWNQSCPESHFLIENLANKTMASLSGRSVGFGVLVVLCLGDFVVIFISLDLQLQSRAL